MVSYSYIKLDRKYIDSTKEALHSIFGEKLSVDSYNSYLKISIENNDSFVFLMTRFAQLIENDLGIKTSCLITPCFNERFVKYLDFFNGVNDVATLFEQNNNSEDVINDAAYFLSLIGSDGLDTINAYIDCNLNAKVAAETLYLHRNSFLYRLNKFNLKSGMDYNSLLTIRFIKSIENLI